MIEISTLSFKKSNLSIVNARKEMVIIKAPISGIEEKMF